MPFAAALRRMARLPTSRFIRPGKGRQSIPKQGQPLLGCGIWQEEPGQRVDESTRRQQPPGFRREV